MNTMNLHHLRYFLIIAEEGSLSAASKKLLVGQPALSSQLRQFEEWLEVQLFHREGKRLQITPAGEYVLKYARAIRELETELILNLSHAGELSKKELVVGGQESVPKAIMAHALSAITKARAVRLKVVEGTGDELYQLLVAGKVDVFIGNLRPLNEGREMIYQSLGKELVSVWGTPEHKNLKRNFPRSLEGASFVLPGFQNPLRHDFERFMLQSGLGFEVAIEAQDTALLKELAARGEGLVILGDESASAWVQSGRLAKIGELPGVKQEYWLGMVKKTIDNDFVKAVLAEFR
jgi:LysR family transcriptional activator of nhaA